MKKYLLGVALATGLLLLAACGNTSQDTSEKKKN